MSFTRALTYTSFNLPSTITQVQGSANYSYTYTYNTERERVKLITARPDDTLTSIYLHPAGKGSLLYEKETRASDGRVEHKHYVNGGAGPVGVYVTYSAGTSPGMRYFHRDHLGSVAAISNEAGALVERLAYEAFGERRNADGSPQDRSSPLVGVTTDRGFTGHEHLDELNLVHMNGRIFDPALGRFMTADPVLQAPDNLQSYNRYSYVLNNPLAYTDPTGYKFKLGNLFKVAAIATIAYVTAGAVSTWYMAGAVEAAGGAMAITGTQFAAASFTAGIVGNAAGGFAAGFLVSGGNIEAGLVGAIGGGIGGALGGSGSLGQAIGGGVNGYLQTGTGQGFARGFAAGAIPQHLGFESAYNTKWYANIGIGIAGDGIRGGIVGGRDGILRGIAIGQSTNALGHLVGMATTGKTPRFDKGAFVYEGDFYPEVRFRSMNEIGQKNAHAITLGNVISGPNGLSNDSAWSVLYVHERSHIFHEGEKALGALYAPVHAVDIAIGRLGRALTGRNSWFILENHMQRCSYNAMAKNPSSCM